MCWWPDAPWCEIKRSHASHGLVDTVFATKKKERFVAGDMVTGRCEPCQIVQVAEVVAKVKGVPVEEVVEAAFTSSQAMFFPWRRDSDAPTA